MKNKKKFKNKIFTVFMALVVSASSIPFGLGLGKVDTGMSVYAYTQTEITVDNGDFSSTSTSSYPKTASNWTKADGSSVSTALKAGVISTNLDTFKEEYKRKQYKITSNEIFGKDVEKIYKSLKKFYKSTYKKFQLEMKYKICLIKENPYVYQSLEKNKNIKRFFIQKYVVFYIIEGKNIIFIRILPQKINYNQKGIYKIKSIK